MAGKIELARPQPIAFSHRRRQHRLLDVLLELGALEVAAQQVAGAELADAKVVGERGSVERRQRAELLAPHFQSSAPRRQT